MSLFGVVSVSWRDLWRDRSEPRCGICGNDYHYVCQYCYEYDMDKLKARIDELENRVKRLETELELLKQRR